MLKEISFKNYKAFESGNLKIKPITILLGANSIGKTSLLQFILMLQQTAIAKDNYKAALKLHGGFLSLGEGKNIFRKHLTEKPVIIKLDFEDNRLVETFSKSLLIDKIIEVYDYARLTDNIKLSFKEKDLSNTSNEVKESLKVFSNFRNFRHNPNFDKKLIDNVSAIIDYSIENTKIIRKKSTEKEFLNEYYLYRLSNSFKHIESKKNEIYFGINFIKSISSLTKPNSRFSLEYEITLVENILVIKNFKYFIDKNLIFDIDLEINKVQKFKLSTPLINDDKIIQKVSEILKRNFVQPKTIFSFLKDEIEDGKMNFEYSYLVEIILEILSSSISSLDDYFDEENINYVSPLRAHPKRYYFLDKAKINTYLDTLDGDALAETLKENEKIKSQVNEWLSKFNLNVQVNKLEDILHKLTVNQNSLTLDITDVGFGISQVLPVIIQGFLSYEDSITLIEQPEIHLHPKMQADLADLFIDIAIKKKTKNKREIKNLIIETHSEYLIKRLRRRISEGEINASDVAIYIIRQNTEADNSIIEELIVEEKGEFKYPIEFYGGELLNDETIFLKNQLS